MKTIILLLCFANGSLGANLQERIDRATPGDTIRIEAGIHAGPIVINKSLTLTGERGAEIRGNGAGNVMTIVADDVTVTGLRVTASGVRLMDDDAAIFVTGNRAKIDNCDIA
ncbi:MAG TPA: hypothetical protein VFJ55_05125, partial [Chthoniobacterales bacterium]|nr:hypothetical protein [Chthoniobacterales bacterium]